MRWGKKFEKSTFVEKQCNNKGKSWVHEENHLSHLICNHRVPPSYIQDCWNFLVKTVNKLLQYLLLFLPLENRQHFLALSKKQNRNSTLSLVTTVYLILVVIFLCTYLSKSIRSQMIFKTGVYNIHKKTSVLFRPATILKRDSNTNVFLWILRNSKKQRFL